MTDNTKQRKFIHDLATPMAAALVIAEVMLERFTTENSSPENTCQAKMLLDNLNYAADLLREQRNKLICEKEHVAQVTSRS